MDALRDGIGLRGYGQRDPKLEYKREGFQMFQEMLFRIRESVCRALTRVHVRREEAPAPDAAEGLPQESGEAAPAAAALDLKHKDGMESAEYSSAGLKEAPARAKVGRNDPCPCGSGLKYKKCCGRGK